MAADFLAWVNANGAILGLLSFLVGLLVGHRMALGRDKRNEWNALVDRIRPALLNGLKHPEGFHFNLADLDQLFETAPRRMQTRIATLMAERQRLADSHSQDEIGAITYTPEQREGMVKAIDGLLAIVRRT